MKKSSYYPSNTKTNKLPLRHEAIRTLTTHELNLVCAGNCLHGSVHTQIVTARAGVC